MDTKTSPRRLSYPDFLRRFKWGIGEHVTALGPTRSGKTTLLFEIIKRRENVVLFLTKPRDPLLDAYIKKEEYARIKKWPASPFDYKVALWPPFTSTESYREHRAVFKRAIDGSGKTPGIFQEGGWTVLIDEVMYFTNRLKLEPEIETLYTQGASNDLTVVGGSQRPRDVPQEMLNQATHFFYWQVADRYELQRMSDVTGNVAGMVKAVVPHLNRYEFLYINRRSGESLVTKVEKRG